MDPEEQRLVPLLKRIDEGSLYVPAAAGAGKSTFCRWAVLQSIPGTTTSHPVPAPEEYQEPVPELLRDPPAAAGAAAGIRQGHAVRARATHLAPQPIWSRRSPPGSTGRRHRA